MMTHDDSSFVLERHSQCKKTYQLYVFAKELVHGKGIAFSGWHAKD